MEGNQKLRISSNDVVDGIDLIDVVQATVTPSDSAPCVFYFKSADEATLFADSVPRRIDTTVEHRRAACLPDGRILILEDGRPRSLSAEPVDAIRAYTLSRLTTEQRDALGIAVQAVTPALSNRETKSIDAQ